MFGITLQFSFRHYQQPRKILLHGLPDDIDVDDERCMDQSFSHGNNFGPSILRRFHAGGIPHYTPIHANSPKPGTFATPSSNL